jgi:hypothetical protein
MYRDNSPGILISNVEVRARLYPGVEMNSRTKKDVEFESNQIYQHLQSLVGTPANSITAEYIQDRMNKYANGEVTANVIKDTDSSILISCSVRFRSVIQEIKITAICKPEIIN